MIDIILPIYKADEIVYKSIDSVINQTYKDWHLIIIDDASKDGMLQNIKDKYINYNNKISYIKLDRNLRAAGARNFAISKSDGKYISFIDQDDLWKKNKLTEYINYFNNNINVKLVHSNIECIDEGDKVIKDFFNKENYIRNHIPYSKLDNYEMAKHLFNYYSIRLGTICVRRKEFLQIGGFDDSLFGGEDEEFIVRFAYNYKIGHIRNKLIYRREHESNTSKVFKDERIIGKLNAIRKMYQKYGFNSDGKNKYVSYLRQVVILLSKNNDNRSRKYAKELIFLSPLKLSNIVLLIFSFLGINIKPTWKIYRKFIKKDKI